MMVSETDISEGKIKRDGSEIYEERLRDILEPKHNGKAVAINVESGDYMVDSSWALAVRRLRERNPEGFVFVRFIGPATPAEHALGRRLTQGNFRRHDV